MDFTERIKSNLCCTQYKAKRRDNKEWIYWDAISGLSGVDIIPGTICRDIGIVDKNKNRMWEHDIFKHYNQVDINEPEYYELGIVNWDERHCRFTNKDAANNNLYSLDTDCVYEVIGNIFDNPELLKNM